MTDQTAQRQKQPQPESFEKAMAELELLVEKMDSSSIGLDQLLEDYRRGAVLVKYCKERLNHIQQEVARIDADLLDESGNPDD